MSYVNGQFKLTARVDNGRSARRLRAISANISANWVICRRAFGKSVCARGGLCDGNHRRVLEDVQSDDEALFQFVLVGNDALFD